MSFDTVWLPERELLAVTLCYRLYKHGKDHELGQRKEERMLWRKNEKTTVEQVEKIGSEVQSKCASNNMMEG